MLVKWCKKAALLRRTLHRLQTPEQMDCNTSISGFLRWSIFKSWKRPKATSKFWYKNSKLSTQSSIITLSFIKHFVNIFLKHYSTVDNNGSDSWQEWRNDVIHLPIPSKHFEINTSMKRLNVQWMLSLKCGGWERLRQQHARRRHLDANGCSAGGAWTWWTITWQNSLIWRNKSTVGEARTAWDSIM